MLLHYDIPEMFLFLKCKRNMRCLHLVDRKEQTCTWTMITASYAFTCESILKHSHTHTHTCTHSHTDTHTDRDTHPHGHTHRHTHTHTHIQTHKHTDTHSPKHPCFCPLPPHFHFRTASSQICQSQTAEIRTRGHASTSFGCLVASRSSFYRPHTRRSSAGILWNSCPNPLVNFGILLASFSLSVMVL